MGLKECIKISIVDIVAKQWLVQERQIESFSNKHLSESRSKFIQMELLKERNAKLMQN